MYPVENNCKNVFDFDLVSKKEEIFKGKLIYYLEIPDLCKYILNTVKFDKL